MKAKKLIEITLFLLIIAANGTEICAGSFDLLGIFNIYDGGIGDFVGIGKGSPFWQPEDKIYEPAVSFFRAGDDGSMYFFNGKEKSIIIFDPTKNSFSEFTPRIEDGYVFDYFLLGPDEMIYARFKKPGKPRPTKYLFRIARFINTSDGYKEDSRFSLGELDKVPMIQSIGPDSIFYMLNNDSAKRGEPVYDAYGPDGKLLESAPNLCATSAGIKFCIRSEKENGAPIKRGINVNSDMEIFKVSDSGGYFKCTYDNSIMVLDWEHDKITLADGNHLQIEKPRILKVKADNAETKEFKPYDSVDSQGFSYKSVGGLDFNYRGELYCVMIFYNVPGKLTGNEKIAIYRWRDNEN